ncbi:ribonuclease H-like domain-containing protein [Salipaludibacillus aurantiacus]|uniref:YprB ribonuclease H-like domain-containing protein n=1 Tax=Salipaludibacillus aurantiacus TaxID=1601833 RepID=A0A1H9WEQ2_9BACI|nr:ribonuclease H-like domain-containing protein [Salipaludibacillus aurantiacus]SES32390.1 hypothetical protein SAMN05518684_11682 [Salipaludibacillus aurantiacus]
MGVKSKLLRMKNHLQLEDKNEPAADKIETPPAPKQDEMETAFKDIGFEPFYFDGERSYRKRILYPYATEQDYNLLTDMERIKQFWGAELSDHPLSFNGKEIDRLLFFDTETTGLSTGAGNVIFLIGYAKLKSEGIEVTQHLLESPSDEAAFLSGFLEDFREDDYLISYNGKSFDWPQVKSRHTFIRKELPKLPEFGHIDLLHSARRLWKHELPSCRLSIVEEKKLNIRRTNDIPGSMAPILYFDYLNDKNPYELKGVIEHNDQDVRSLVHLYKNLVMKLIWENEVPSSGMEHYYMGEWFDKLSIYEWAEKHYEHAIHKTTTPFPQVYYKLGVMYKKLGDKEKAGKYLELALKQGAFPPVEAWIERSKLAEHYEKDPAKAYDYAKQGYQFIKKNGRFNDKKYTRQLADLNKRLKRLEKKQAF